MCKSPATGWSFGVSFMMVCGPSYLKQKGPGLNEASTTPTCYYTQEIETPAVEENLPSSLAEQFEEPSAITNFSPDMELETINLSDDLNV